MYNSYSNRSAKHLAQAPSAQPADNGPDFEYPDSPQVPSAQPANNCPDFEYPAPPQELRAQPANNCPDFEYPAPPQVVRAQPANNGTYFGYPDSPQVSSAQPANNGTYFGYPDSPQVSSAQPADNGTYFGYPVSLQVLRPADNSADFGYPAPCAITSLALQNPSYSPARASDPTAVNATSSALSRSEAQRCDDGAAILLSEFESSKLPASDAVFDKSMAETIYRKLYDLSQVTCAKSGKVTPFFVFRNECLWLKDSIEHLRCDIDDIEKFIVRLNAVRLHLTVGISEHHKHFFQEFEEIYNNIITMIDSRFRRIDNGQAISWVSAQHNGDIGRCPKEEISRHDFIISKLPENPKHLFNNAFALRLYRQVVDAFLSDNKHVIDKTNSIIAIKRLIEDLGLGNRDIAYFIDQFTSMRRYYEDVPALPNVVDAIFKTISLHLHQMHYDKVKAYKNNMCRERKSTYDNLLKEHKDITEKLSVWENRLESVQKDSCDKAGDFSMMSLFFSEQFDSVAFKLILDCYQRFFMWWMPRNTIFLETSQGISSRC